MMRFESPSEKLPPCPWTFHLQNRESNKLLSSINFSAIGALLQQKKGLRHPYKLPFVDTRDQGVDIFYGANFSPLQPPNFTHEQQKSSGSHGLTLLRGWLTVSLEQGQRGNGWLSLQISYFTQSGFQPILIDWLPRPCSAGLFFNWALQ
jgi:hypothetical protein